MHPRRKKHIQIPITSRAQPEGRGLRVALLLLAVLIGAGLLYAFLMRPELIARLAHLDLGKSMIGTLHL